MAEHAIAGWEALFAKPSEDQLVGGVALVELSGLQLA
jgi:hypothetical protein